MKCVHPIALESKRPLAKTVPRNAPTEGAHIMGLIEAYRRTLETCELEARVVALETGAA